MRIKIQKSTKRDLPAFYKLFKKSLFEDFKEFSPEVANFQWRRHRKKNLLKWIKKGDEYIFTAKNIEGKIVGFLVSQKLVGGVAECDWLIVSRGFRGQGIGHRLMSFWERWVKKMKGHMLALFSDRKLIKYYRKLGFKEYGYLRGGYFGESDYLLYKRLGKWNQKSLKS